MAKNRKDSHITLCLEEAVEFYNEAGNGFINYRFDHDALPEVDKSRIDLSTVIYGKQLSAPLIIGAMTGGTERAAEINRRLAQAARHCRVGFSLGSQRPMLEDPHARASYAVRNDAPDLPLLIGNIGAVQLNYGVGLPEVKFLIENVGCDVFAFHLNPLQESIQPEGNTNFSGLLMKLKTVISELSTPVSIKEVGSGISEATAIKLRDIPIKGVETAGLGGTSWSKVESLRAQNPIQRSTGELFARWGIPTAESISICRKILSDRTIIASGGVRNGIEGGKALALGADGFAMALPFLKAADQSVEAVVMEIERVLEELRTCMFLTGSRTITELKQRPLRCLK